MLMPEQKIKNWGGGNLCLYLGNLGSVVSALLSDCVKLIKPFHASVHYL